MGYDIKCCDCGKFCVPFDSGTVYGNVLSLEPPEPEFFCEKCYLARLRTDSYSAGWWIVPSFAVFNMNKEKARMNGWLTIQKRKV